MRKFYIFFIVIATAAVVGTAVFTVGLDRIFTPEIIPRSDLGIDRALIRIVLEVPGFSYKISVPEGSTAYDLMVEAASQYDNFSFRGREFSGLGFFVEEINGLSQDQKEGMYWIYYINGQSAPIGVSLYEVKANDVITWKYEQEH